MSLLRDSAIVGAATFLVGSVFMGITVKQEGEPVGWWPYVGTFMSGALGFYLLGATNVVKVKNAESTGCYECGQDYEGDDDFRNCDLCDVLLCSGCNRPCEGCSNTVCNSHRCSKDCCDGAFCDECHEEEFGAESFSAEFVPPYNRGKGLDFGRDNKGRYRRKLTIPISETAQKEIRQDRKRRYLVSGGQEQERCVECRRPVSANEVASLRNVILCKSCVGSLEKSN